MRAVVFSPDGRLLYASSRAPAIGGDGNVRCWELASGAELWARRVRRSVEWLSLAPDGRWLAYGGPARPTEVWLVAD